MPPSMRALAREAGAVALDVMPPHHWLRFGCTPGHALEYFDAIHRAAPGLDLVCHVYPAWTRASYSSQLLADLARLPYVQAFKVGQRDMNKYARDIEAIRDADASKAILTCHDEYLLASMVQGVDGALVGLRDVHPAAHRRPVGRREGRRPQARDGDPGDRSRRSRTRSTAAASPPARRTRG